jgi:3-methyladenine DNA glycosylase AlkC
VEAYKGGKARTIMAKTFALKDYYGTELAKLLAGEIKKAYKPFDDKSFVKYVSRRIKPLELKDRLDLMAKGMKVFLPADYRKAIKILISTLGPPNPKDEGMFLYGYKWVPIGSFIAMYGTEHPDASLEAIYEFTRRNTSEFAVRPLIKKYPARIIKVFKKWAKDESSHVRRLVSEGTRPRLPWAGKLDVFKDNPQPVLELLEMLKEDTSAFVRKSVANHLNDIIKENRKLGMEVITRWSRSGNKNTADIVRHALRNLIKEGDAEAFKLLGYNTKCSVEAKGLRLSAGNLRIGGAFNFTFTLFNKSNSPSRVIVDYVIHYMKSSGRHSEKVFKLCEKDMRGKEEINISKGHKFAELTTRKHYPGRHKIEIQVNGKRYAGKEFILTA